MTEKTRNILITLSAALVLAIITFLAGRCTAPQPEEKIEFKTDTLLIKSWDTLYVDTIIYKERKVLDTVYLHDTILLREQLEYEDSLSHVWVSGIEPSIDSIVHFIPRDTVIVNNETTITKIQKKKWALVIGVGGYFGAGAGYCPMTGKFGVQAPEVGIGVIIGGGYVIK